MSSTANLDDDLRAAIVARAGAILDDRDVMNALIAANDQAMGGNVVDLRGIAMDRLESRLDRLRDTHETVVSAAYDNLAGTNQVHSAVLRLLDADDFDTGLQLLRGGIAAILRLESVALVLESAPSATAAVPARLGGVLTLAEPGFAARYIGTDMARQVTLRVNSAPAPQIHGKAADKVRSEACLQLHLGADSLPGLLVLGSADPHQFEPKQGTDLLAFFAGAVERCLIRWLK